MCIKTKYDKQRWKYMRIVVCSGNDQHRKQILTYLDAFHQGIVSFKTQEYQCGIDLLEDLKKGIRCDVVFLDVDFIEKDVAKKIRALDTDVLLIFTANLHDQISCAFEVQAFHYLLEPINFHSFSNTLNRAFQRYYEKRKVFKVEWKHQVKSILLNKIIYIECFNRHILLRTTNDLLESSQSFHEIVEKLIPAGFIRVHQSFLVNLSHMEGINQNEILCTDGITVPISIRRKKEVLEQFRVHLQKLSI